MTFKLANITELRQAKAMGLKNMYYAFWYPLPLLMWGRFDLTAITGDGRFFYDPLATGYILRPDWQQRWAAVEPGQEHAWLSVLWCQVLRLAT